MKTKLKKINKNKNQKSIYIYLISYIVMKNINKVYIYLMLEQLGIPIFFF